FSSPKSTNSNINTQTTISDLGRIISGTVNTGSYTYSISDNNVNVSFSGGSPQGTTQDSMEVTDYRTNKYNNDFPDYIDYTYHTGSGTYSGRIYKDGDPYSYYEEVWIPPDYATAHYYFSYEIR